MGYNTKRIEKGKKHYLSVSAFDPERKFWKNDNFAVWIDPDECFTNIK
jgi:NAD-dependent dihydropyrimidine dehydrogenase PreA subunit